MPTVDYLLGYSDDEAERLDEQHALWGPGFLDELASYGLRRGARVLEVGCGTGSLLSDLAQVVGPDGACHGIELDGDSVERARARCAELPWVQVREGDVLKVDLPADYDLVVARWVLSFVPDVQQAVERLASAVRPGGHLALQDYVHDGLRIAPGHASTDAVIHTLRAAYKGRGGDLWVAERLPGDMARAGLTLRHIESHVSAGRPGSPAWRWVEQFLHQHVDELVRETGAPKELPDEFRARWAELLNDPGAVLFSPQVVTVIAQAP